MIIINIQTAFRGIIKLFVSTELINVCVRVPTEISHIYLLITSNEISYRYRVPKIYTSVYFNSELWRTLK